MTRIYLVRHAEAEGNLYRRAHGWYDSLITARGYQQLVALRERFREIPLEAVYSSDLFRTQTTARALYEPKGLPLTVLPLLREIGVGAWEDMPWAELTAKEKENLIYFNTDITRWSVEGGETAEEVQHRMLTAIKLLHLTHPNGTVAAVSHGMALRLLFAAVTETPLSQFGTLSQSDNTAVSLLEVDGDKIRLVFQDDNSHLTEDLSTLARQSWWKDKSTLEAGIHYAPTLPDRDYFALLEQSGITIAPELLQRYADQSPQALWTVLQENRPVGAVVLDTREGLLQKEGHLAGFGLLPELRHRGFGEQLLGQAVSVYRPLQRELLVLPTPATSELTTRYQTYGLALDDKGRYTLPLHYCLREF